MFGGMSFWFPKMFGRMMNEGVNKLHFWLTFIGVYCIFGPMHYLGMIAHPRRYPDIVTAAYLGQNGAAEIHYFITMAAMITVTAQFLFLFNFLWCLFKGKKVTSDNPWEATTLEWTVSSPPAHDNFEGKIPVVYRGPYEFAVPKAKRDFVMQCNSDEMAFGRAPAGD
jgi:cytochrome c oxidase subunit 1